MLKFLGIVLLSALLLHGSTFAGGVVTPRVAQIAKGIGKQLATLGTVIVLSCSTMSCGGATPLVAKAMLVAIAKPKVDTHRIIQGHHHSGALVLLHGRKDLLHNGDEGVGDSTHVGEIIHVYANGRYYIEFFAQIDADGQQVDFADVYVISIHRKLLFQEGELLE